MYHYHISALLMYRKAASIYKKKYKSEALSLKDLRVLYACHFFYKRSEEITNDSISSYLLRLGVKCYYSGASASLLFLTSGGFVDRYKEFTNSFGKQCGTYRITAKGLEFLNSFEKIMRRCRHDF